VRLLRSIKAYKVHSDPTKGSSSLLLPYRIKFAIIYWRKPFTSVTYSCSFLTQLLPREGWHGEQKGLCCMLDMRLSCRQGQLPPGAWEFMTVPPSHSSFPSSCVLYCMFRKQGKVLWNWRWTTKRWSILFCGCTYLCGLWLGLVDAIGIQTSSAQKIRKFALYSDNILTESLEDYSL